MPPLQEEQKAPEILLTNRKTEESKVNQQIKPESPNLLENEGIAHFHPDLDGWSSP